MTLTPCFRRRGCLACSCAYGCVAACLVARAGGSGFPYITGKRLAGVGGGGWKTARWEELRRCTPCSEDQSDSMRREGTLLMRNADCVKTWSAVWMADTSLPEVAWLQDGGPLLPLADCLNNAQVVQPLSCWHRAGGLMQFRRAPSTSCLIKGLRLGLISSSRPDVNGLPCAIGSSS